MRSPLGWRRSTARRTLSGGGAWSSMHWHRFRESGSSTSAADRASSLPTYSTTSIGVLHWSEWTQARRCWRWRVAVAPDAPMSRSSRGLRPPCPWMTHPATRRRASKCSNTCPRSSPPSASSAECCALAGGSSCGMSTGRRSRGTRQTWPGWQLVLGRVGDQHLVHPSLPRTAGAPSLRDAGFDDVVCTGHAFVSIDASEGTYRQHGRRPHPRLRPRGTLGLHRRRPTHGRLRATAGSRSMRPAASTSGASSVASHARSNRTADPPGRGGRAASAGSP